jgi:hypothetical protein
VSATDAASGLSNITIYLFDEFGVLLDTTNSTVSPLFAQFSSLPNGVYLFNASAYDRRNNSNWTNTTTVTVYVPSRPPSSGGSNPLKTVSLTYDFNCSSGELVVSANSSWSIIPDLEIRLIRTLDFATVSEKTNATGLTRFVIDRTADYELYSASTYTYLYSNTAPFRLVLCNAVNVTLPVNETQPEINLTNETVPTNGTTINVTKPITNVTIQTNVSAQWALLEQQLLDKQAMGYDVSAASALLQQAKTALDAGNYELANVLLKDVSTALRNASFSGEEAGGTGTTNDLISQLIKLISDNLIPLAVGALLLVGISQFLLRKGKKGESAVNPS